MIEQSTIAGNTGGNEGGGILNDGTLTIMNSTIGGTAAGDGNAALQGGGISSWNDLGSMTISDTKFEDNTGVNLDGGAGTGGGIFSTTPLTVTGSTFSGNSAFYGGGIEILGSATIDDDQFTQNQALDGAAIANGGELTASGCTISKNMASGSGGGLFNSSGSAKFSNGTISNNQAGFGGGIYVKKGAVTLTIGTVSQNTASTTAAALTTMPR